jgi:hypothetical protein
MTMQHISGECQSRRPLLAIAPPKFTLLMAAIVATFALQIGAAHGVGAPTAPQTWSEAPVHVQATRPNDKEAATKEANAKPKPRKKAALRAPPRPSAAPAAKRGFEARDFWKDQDDL